MALPVAHLNLWDDQEYYPIHEEDGVPENPPHEATVRDLRTLLALRVPGWLVTGNVCVYGEPGNTKRYRAPDVLVVSEPLSEPVHRVYQTWKQPRVAFVAEIGSRSTFREDVGPKLEIYQDQIKAGEYFYSDPPHGDRRMRRLGPNGYEWVDAEPNGRLRSEALGLEFDLDADGQLRIYTLEGERLLTPAEIEGERVEEVRRREEAEARAAERERQLTELRARLEDRQ